ncbi:hypothetical protein ACIQI8_41445 [Streptomyces sp. NPDC092369]|uniref:AAA family ATPase n=1 Tax=Streptomyces sp. NPDC092369 TaxID=3366015 RepID=UPI00382F11DB
MDGAVVYLATALKSIAVYRGFNAARRTGLLLPPAHILNAPTRLMKDLGYGKGYQYDPDTFHSFSGADHFREHEPRDVPRTNPQRLRSPDPRASARAGRSTGS